MRERTPSADDTPKRAPPAPPGEADVAVRKATDVASAAACGASKMVASTHSLDDLGVSHLGSSASQQQPPSSAQQHHHSHHHHPHHHHYHPAHHHHYHLQQQSSQSGKSSQSTQDKRSRLSNVINNLRKKVPPEASIKRDCPSSAALGKPSPNEDGSPDSARSSLETLERYMMTVLSGVIEPEEEKRPIAGKKEQPEPPAAAKAANELAAESNGPKDAKDPDGAAAAPATAPAPQDDKPDRLEPAEASDLDAAVPRPLDGPKLDDAAAAVKAPASSSTAPSDGPSEPTDSPAAEATEEAPRSLGDIILDRLTEHRQEPEQLAKKDRDAEARAVCTELLDRLLDEALKASLDRQTETTTPEEPSAADGSTQSLHCSLPLDKVASVLPSCQTSPSSTPTTTTTVVTQQQQSASSPGVSPPKVSVAGGGSVRHLCLYCERKFPSLALRQRHTARVHQVSLTRRSSERTARKSSQQSCQYCVDKCTDNLEALFQHLVGSHSDKYHGCLQCSTRYQSKDALTSHIHEIHSHLGVQPEKLKEPILLPASLPSNLEPKASAATPASAAVKLVVKEEPPPAPSDSPAHEQSSSSTSSSATTSVEFDAFYSTVSCNIRENLLHHLDGKLHKSEPSSAAASSISPPLGALAASFDLKPTVYQQQPQQQLPIDISLTAVTPVYSKQATDPEDFGNSSEQAGKPGKSSLRSHPHRRVSFEKYNFPRKYDSKQQWTCSIKDLSRFDISTQLSLRNKQKLAESSAAAGEMTSLKESHEHQEEKLERKEGEKEEESKGSGVDGEAVRVNGEEAKDAEKCAVEDGPAEQEATVFSSDFDNFMRLKKCANSVEQRESQERLVYAELTGEWSRPRVYVCGACADRFVTLRDLEEHKSLAHPNVWCMHFEFSGEQRELYKHLVFLPTAQRSPSPIFGVSSIKTRQQTTAERVCTKCSKVCASLADLHRHMLECGGDQAWLLGLFGNGKKKCKWRPFGSRSRRRRQRGMKRNIQNSQTQPRNYVPRERPQHTGPRVRPSDRESIQKMLANLPAKRATRKVLQENAMVRSQGRLRSAQSRGGAPDNPASLMVKSKAVLRNKLLKNAKSYQRKKNLREEKEARVSGEARGSSSSSNSPSSQSATAQPSANKGGRLLRNLRVLGKRRNVRSSSLADQPAAGLRRRIKLRSATRQNVPADEPSSPEPVRRRTLLAKPPNKRPDESPAAELLQPRKRRKKGRRLLAESRLSPSSSSGLPSASTKTPKQQQQQQPRGNDGKFATSSLRQRAQVGMVEPPGRLLTRSKLRAAAKLAWQEHTRISRRVTRLALLDLAEKASREISSEPAELDETAAQSANATDEQPNEPVEQTKPKRTFSRNSSTSRRSLDGFASLEDSSKPETNAALPALGLRGRRPKKDLPSPNVTADDLPLVVLEPASELILTRSQRSLSSSLGSKAESKTRRSLVTSREAKELALSPLELPKKSAKSPDVADAAATATCAAVDSVADKSGLRTRSNSRAKKETKESVVDIIARKIAMEIAERKTSKRGQKDVSDKRDKSLTVDKSTDSEIEVASSSKKIGLPSALRKSLRKKEPELKEGVDEVPKTENSCKPTVGDIAKTAEIPVTNAPLDKEEDKQLDSTESVSKKLPTGRRRGRAKRNVVVVEDTAEEPEEIPAVSEEAPVQEPLIELPKDTISVPESPIVDLEDKSNQVEDSSITEPKENIVSNGLQPNIEHLQHESSNSNMDSGKENSADTVVISPKSKLTRPRKTRVLRKDGKPTQTSGKRSLSSVIGILTEAVNVPVLEEPTTTVLTVQTSFDNPTAEHAFQSSELNVAVLESTDVGEKSTEQSPVSANSSVEEKPVSEDVAKEVIKEAVKEADQPKKPEEKETAAADKKEETVPAEPATDIILDLSRRKPKGKGSFLEKIVSKIAKQKDVSLEVDSVSRAQRNQDDAEKIKSQECTKPVEPSVLNVVAAPSEQLKSSEPVVATINVEASVESSQTADDMSSAKLNEATSVNSVNNAKALAVEDVAEIKEQSLCSIDSKVHESAVGIEVKSDDKDTSEEIKKDDDDKSVFNCAIDNVDKPEKLAEVVKEDAVPEDKPEGKKNLKKRSLEVSLPRSSKKKPVDNDNSELEERDEICLADIMKLIDRSTAKEKTEESSVELEVKPGKRKSPEDDMEFKVDENSSKTTADCSRENEEKTTKKAKRKGAQKKNKREAFKLANDNDENSEKEAVVVAVKHNSDVSVIESTLADCSVDVKLTNDSNDIADNEVSAINLGPIVDCLEEHKIPDSKESVDETCSNARQSVELSKTSDEESLSVNVLDVQSLISEEDKTDEKVTKRKMRSRKRNSDIVKEIEPQIVNDEKPEDNSIKSDVEDSSIDAQDESFKVPEITKVTKSSKKRNSRSKSKKSIEPQVCVEENDVELEDDVVQKQRTSKRNASRLNSKYLELEESAEKNEATAEDDAVQKQRTLRSKVKKHVELEGFVEKNDAQDDEDDNVQKQRSSNRRSLRSKQKQTIDEQNSSESEDVAASNRSTPKRHTRSSSSSSSSNNIEETLTSSKMSEDLETTADESTSIVNTNESKDATVNNESLEEDKPEKRQFRERKAKKTVTLSEKVEIFGDSEAVTETKHKASEPSAIVAEPMSVEKDAVANDKEPSIIEEPREVEVATPAEVVKSEAEPVEQDQPQAKILEPERSMDLEEKDQIPDQPLNSPDSPSSSIDDTDNKSPIAQEVASSSETEEQSSSSELTGPKKRALGNFSVVNKSGKILIVEKKKKLTKEAAKFFCSLCATSFTRKSSLKKHNLSQSHVLQVTMNSSKGVVKDVTEEQLESDTKDEEQKSNWDEEEKEEKIEQEKAEDDSTVVKETQVAEPMLLAPESSVEQITDPVQPIPKPIEPTKILTPVPEFFHTTTTPTLPELSFLAHKSPEQLEDEMLDEEICKITENMSHDEYVLTDHVSPITPEAASTPIRKVTFAEKESSPVVVAAKRKKEKKEKKKKNLADEHLSLDTPVPVTETPTNANINDSVTINDQLEDSAIVDQQDNICQSEDSKVSEADSTFEQVRSDKKDVKSKINLEEKIDDTRRTTRNRNQISEQNVSVALTDNHARPKRNQLRPSYKEDENFDFEIESLGNRSEEELKSKISKMNISTDEIQEPESGVNQLKDNAKVQSSKDHASIAEIDSSVSDKEILSEKKIKGRKSKRRVELDNTTKVSLDLESKENIKIDEDNDNTISLEKSETENLISVSKEQSIVEAENLDESQTTGTGKKKRGRKPKKASGEMDKTMDEQLDTTNLAEETERDHRIVEKLASPRLGKTTKNQNKKPKITDALAYDESTTNNVDQVSSHDHTSSKHERKTDEIKSSKSDKVLQSCPKQEPTAVFLPVDAAKVLKSPTESKNCPDSQQHLVFPSLSSDNFKPFTEPKADLVAPNLGGFDSDDNSDTDTNMSVKIQKLLDDPEMTSEIGSKRTDEDSPPKDVMSRIEPVDVLNVAEPLANKSPASITPIPAIASVEAPPTEAEIRPSTERAKKSPRSAKSTSAKAKHRSRKSKSSSSRSKASSSEESEPEQAKLPSSKNKIVKCVFGRVFAGNEKPDKVKEVLDDWQSRSDNDSPSEEEDDSEADSSKSQQARKSRSRTRKAQLRANGPEASRKSSGRQSKRRAEELISKAFDEDLGRTDQTGRSAKKLGKRPQNDSACLGDKQEIPSNDEEFNEEATASAKSKKAKRKKEEQETKQLNEEPDEEVADHAKTQTDSSHDAVEKVENEEEQQEEVELSSRDYQQRNGSSGIEEGKDRSSASEDEKERQSKQRSRKSHKKKSSSRRVEQSSADGGRREATMAYAPSDALEDNALDVDAARSQTRLTKVLNFDEELFVECCSRLKASEKELRATKKIKLDQSAEELIQANPSTVYHHHHHHHHKRDEQHAAGHKATKDRWRDVESQNSLGSLLESVNQLLGEEYNSREREYSSSSGTKRSRNHHHHHHHHHHHNHHHRSSGHHHHHNHHHHHHNRYNNSSSTANPNGRSSPEDNVTPSRPSDYFEPGYDDSLDVAFEHNNKLRDKIQRRMRESESLIATSFGQHTKSQSGSPAAATEAAVAYEPGYGNLDAGKAKINNGFGGLVDKALSNFLHSNEKHDHNGSTPMKLLAELACARAPSVTTPTIPEKPAKLSPKHDKDLEVPITEQKKPQPEHESKPVAASKKSKNPIKELFERKKEMQEKRQQQQQQQLAKTERSRKQKKTKSGSQQHNLPLIRTGQYRGGMAERKRRRGDSAKKKDLSHVDVSKIKDVYDFDEEEEEAKVETGTNNTVLSYRAKPETPGREFSMSALLSKAIGDVLSNGKSVTAMTENLENMIDREFQDIENYEKPAGKATKDDDKQESVIGPMDEYVERKQKSSKRTPVGEVVMAKHSSKSKKKSVKSGKRKSRNAWYEDDSSDEFVTRLKTDDLAGVGINKSQRTCSKGKQNLFAEMSSTSSESEFELEEAGVDDVDGCKDVKKHLVAKEAFAEKNVNETAKRQTKGKDSISDDEFQNGESQEVWSGRENNSETVNNELPYRDLDNNKKSESELSDHPLVIDENQKEPTDLEQRTNSDDETEGLVLDLDDLYREDSSIIDSDRDELSIVTSEDKSTPQAKTSDGTVRDKQSNADKYISVEDALELLDRPQEVGKKPRTPAKMSSTERPRKSNKRNIDSQEEDMEEEEEETGDSRAADLPEKLSGNEKPKRESENLPLHVFLSRKVQESKKRKQQELKRLREEQERMLLELQPTRRQRKCAIGKQGLLAEISSSDEEPSSSSIAQTSGGEKSVEGHERSRIAGKQRQRESKEKRKERYIEKKHEQMIAKEQKAIEEAILRELEEKRLSAASEASGSERDENNKQTSQRQLDCTSESEEQRTASRQENKARKHKQQSCQQESTPAELDSVADSQTKRPKSIARTNTDNENDEAEADEAIVPDAVATPVKKRRATSKSPQKSSKKSAQSVTETRKPAKRATPGAAQRRSKNRTSSVNRSRELKEQSAKSSDLDGDEELKATKSWKKVDEAVGVAIGRRKRAAANQLYYWSSSSEEEDEELAETESPKALEQPTGAANGSSQENGQEDERQEQHGWIVGDSHKRMITMLAMEKQMKEKRRRSENDEQQSVVGGANNATPVATAASPASKTCKTKKHRNSTS